VTGDATGGTAPPDWDILVSHHLPPRYDRTIPVRTRRRTIHICARCTGQLLGGVGFLLLYLGSSTASLPLFVASTQLWFAFAPLPAAIDWVTQSSGTRESTNAFRLASGALLALALTDALALLFTERWTFLLAAVLVAGLYLGVILLILKLTGAWRRVLEEHFPGLQFETT
jgi:uncharacterized membrane protein